MLGFRLYSVLRPLANSHNAAVGGGIAFLTRGTTLVTIDAAPDKRGAASVIISVPGKERVAVVGAYLPPLTRDNEELRDELILYVSREYRRLSGQYKTFVCMDANARCHEVDGVLRLTTSAPPRDSYYHRQSMAQLHALLHALGIRPVHGRVGQLRGECTSRQPGRPHDQRFMSEIDFTCTGPDVKATALPYPDWDMDNLQMHRLVAVEIEVTSCTLQPTRPKLPVVTDRPHIETYDNKEFWINFAEGYQSKFDEIASPLFAPGSTATASEKIVAMEEVLHSQLHPPLRQRKTTFRANIIRKFRGFGIPPDKAEQLNELRKILKAKRKLNRTGRRLNNHHFHVMARKLNDAAVKAQREIVGDLKPVIEGFKHHLTFNFKRARKSDASLYFRLLDAYQTADMDVYYEKSGIPIPVTVFHEYYTKTNEAGPPPPALSPSHPLAPRNIMPSLPPDVCPNLGREMTKVDVYRTLYGHAKPLPFRRCSTDCELCKHSEEIINYWKTHPSFSRPGFSGRVKTSKAAGDDGLLMEGYSWQRLRNERRTLGHRLTICAALAETFNATIASANIPENFGDSIINPLFKELKASQPAESDEEEDKAPPPIPPDRKAPPDYRPVSLIRLHNKILKTILNDRMQHLTVTHGVTGPEQAGFIFKRSCERNAFVLNETIKARLRKGLSTYLLFIDFSKAYDMVDHNLLLECLKAVGIDEKTRDLLKAIMSTASARVNVNGEKSEPIPVRTGVPQGDPLSCLLFAIFIESLSRYLRSCTDINGVEVLGCIIRHLLFADDLVIFASSEEELERALHHIARWAEAWGMKLNTKRGKSHAMRFTPTSIEGSAKEARNRPPLKAGDLTVEWTSCYRYLGFVLRHDLKTDHIVDHKYRSEWAAHHKIFKRTTYAAKSSTGEQIQLSNNLQQGQITYLLSLADLTAQQAKKLNEPIIASAYAMLGRKKSECTSQDAAMCATRSLYAEEVAARERERLRLTLEHCFYRKLPVDRWPPCTRLYDALKAEPTSEASLSGPIQNWAHRTASLRREHVEEGADGSLTPTITRPISSCAHAYARSLAYARLKTKLGPAPPGYASIPLAEPRTRGSLQNFLTLTFHMTGDGAEIGDAHGYTRLSMPGSGSFSGNLIGIAQGGKYQSVKNLWLGSEANNLPPFRDVKVPVSLRGGAILSHATRHSKICCRTCPAEHETVWHLICECPHPSLVEARNEVWASLKEMLLKVLKMTRRIAVGTAFYLPLTNTERAEITRLLGPDAPTPSPAEVNFLLYWGLHGQPWPASVASPLSQRTSFLLGKLFDSIYASSSRLRRLADTWLTWAESRIRSIAAAHHVALPPVHLQPPPVPPPERPFGYRRRSRLTNARKGTRRA